MKKIKDYVEKIDDEIKGAKEYIEKIKSGERDFRF